MRPAENYALSTLGEPSFWNAVASGRKCRDLAILSTLFLAIGPAWAPGYRVTNRAAVRYRCQSYHHFARHHLHPACIHTGVEDRVLERLDILLVDRCPQSAHRVYTFSA